MFLFWLELDNNKRYRTRRSLSVVDLIEKTVFVIKKHCVLGEVGTVVEEAVGNPIQDISNNKSRI